MKQFIYSLVFVFLTNTSFSQTEELVLKKSFEVNQNTILNLDVDNTTIQFIESTDDKIHIDYSILFKKDSEEFVYKAFKDLYASATKNNNVVNLEVKNSMYLSELYFIEVDIDTYKKHIKNFFSKIKRNKIVYKSKDSLLKEINFSSGPDSNDYFRKLKRENPNKDFGKLKRRFEQKFTIKAPKYLMLKIKALRSKINFNYDISKSIELNSFNTYLKFKNIASKQNKFSLHSGIFQSEKVTGGDYFFKDVTKVSIGSISDLKLDTETSKIQIGEINEKVKIKDFNSKFNFYNFSNSFKVFDFKGDYSKLHFFKNEDVYSLTAFGNTTAFKIDNKNVGFEPKKDVDKFTMLEKKAPKNKQSYGHINLNITHGIIEIISNEKE